MKSINIAIATACLSLSLAQADIISGTVTDAADQSPIAGAKVSTDQTHWTTSGADGRYSLNTEVVNGVQRQSLPPRMYWDSEARQFRWAAAYGAVTVDVRDIRGNMVDRQVAKESQSGGGYSFTRQASGIHIVTLTSQLGTFRFRIYKVDGNAAVVKEDNSAAAFSDGPLAKSAQLNSITFSKPNYAPQTKQVNGNSSATDVALVGSDPITLDNGIVQVTYTKAGGALTAKNLASGIVFIKSATLSQTGGTVKYVDGVTENNFTGGQSVDISYSDGNKDRILLFPNSQFVYFKKYLGNKTGSDRVFDKIPQVNVSLSAGSTGTLAGAGTAVGLSATQNSYCFLALADPATRHGLVGAWVTNSLGIGIVQGGSGPSMTGVSEYGFLNVKPNATREADMFEVGYFDDARLGLEANADDIAKAYAIKMKPNQVVWCTWQSVGGAGSPSIMSSTSQWLKDNLVPFGFSVAQIDDGWQQSHRNFLGTKSGWTGITGVATSIKNNNLTAGLWFMPFAADATISSSWYLRDKNGGTENSSWAETSMDVTKPEVQNYIKTVTDNVYNKWGYGYFKVDGMFTGLASHQNYINDEYKTDDFFFNARMSDKYQSNVEAYRNAWKVIRANAPNAFIMGCTIAQNMRTLPGSMGVMDALRIGPDGKDDWDGIENRGICRANRRYFYNGRVFWIDPDPVFTHTGWGQNHCGWNALTGMMYTPAEKFESLSAPQVDILKRTMPFHGSLNVRPADFFERNNPGIWLLTDERSGVRRDVIGIFNPSNTSPFTGSYDLKKLGLKSAGPYVGFDFWGNKFVAPFSGSFPYLVAGAGARIVSVREVTGNPVLVGTSRHVADPVYSVSSETWSGGALSGTSKVVGKDDYELRIYAGKNGGGQWTAGTPTADNGATITVQQSTTEVRVTIKSATSQNIKWSVPFN
jgi:hypothetical protein